jgi:hypothetical protein
MLHYLFGLLLVKQGQFCLIRVHELGLLEVLRVPGDEVGSEQQRLAARVHADDRDVVVAAVVGLTSEEGKRRE